MMMYCVNVTLHGVKVSYLEQNWLVGTFSKFLGVEITDTESQILAFSLYAKVKLLKTKQNLNDDDVFIKVIRFLQAYETDFILHEVGKDLKKCYSLFEKLKKLEKEKKILDVGSLQFDKNGLLLGVINNAGCTVTPKFFDFEPCELFNNSEETNQQQNDIF